MDNLILTTLSPLELKELIREELKLYFDSREIGNKPPVEILNGDELAIKLDITVQTLLKWRQKGRIPFIKIGSAIRYDLHKVLEALEVKNKR